MSVAFWSGSLLLSGMHARPVGNWRSRPVWIVPIGCRPRWAAADGTPRRCATRYARRSSTVWVIQPACWWSMRLVSSRRARTRWVHRGTIAAEQIVSRTARLACSAPMPVPAGQALIDRRLYLPEVWASDAVRRDKVGAPRSVTFATRTGIVRAFATALDAGVPCA